jgi:phosphoadenosine phosphosulfate reductase
MFAGESMVSCINNVEVSTQLLLWSEGFYLFLELTTICMPEGFHKTLDVDYTDGEGESPAAYPRLEDKIEKAIAVTKEGLETYDNPVVMWTGGKDSTLTLYFIQEVARNYDLETPPTVFIDHYQHFDEIHDFVDRWADRWDLDVIYARNEDVGSYVDTHGLNPGDEIPVAELSEHNQHHIRDLLEYEEETFPFLLDTYVGNHLLKTVALNETLEARDVDGVISGVRWDEQEARAEETFFSPRHDPDIYPPHDRVQPILQFDERAVWDTFWNFVVPDSVEAYPDEGYVPTGADDLPTGVDIDDIPVSPKYFAGFRSLGSEVSTEKTTADPAWLQDVENTVEREGRAQDKEDLMERLRDLGYM